ncbi:nicotinate-nucleotide--dimethylbenzimidazole phosphoribosyltransferase, partial [Burkholderia pseudomallei]|uniref:nicotinate-nucleotide--dimethylbenzimidazole phosphoribosyltransferase n=1 Tax=Burkholderia pseudomallei TaxID=28450 RepID=UPI0021F6DE77
GRTRACVGQGTGATAGGVAHKGGVLGSRLTRQETAREPLAVLAAFGGCEVALIAGAFIEAAYARKAILVDGFIAAGAVTDETLVARHGGACFQATSSLASFFRLSSSIGSDYALTCLRTPPLSASFAAPAPPRVLLNP